MNIIIVGGGTAGWVNALMAAKRHPYHHITVIDSSKIGVVGVGESTTGRLTDILTNHFYDFGCNLHDFMVETGSTIKYGIKHKGWTNDIDNHYIGPIDGSWSNTGVPDPLFSWGLDRLKYSDLLTTSRCGYWIAHKRSNFNIKSQSFEIASHAMHVDAHLVGKYFKKVCLQNPNATHIDSEVLKVNLNPETGNIESLLLSNGNTIHGDLFIDCSGFHKILIKELPNKWISYQNNLPLNSAIPFWTEYEKDETPEMCTTAWAQQNGWMWSIPMMDRKGNGYVFCDAYTTPEKAQQEIETKLGREVNVQKVIKFDAGRQESAWVKNCITIGLSTAFLEPLEATSIHSTIVQGQTLVFEFIKPTIEETLNEGCRNIFNARMRNMYDDVKDFLVMHYMGGRDDSEFWKYIKTGATKTDFVSNLIEMAKTKIPSVNDFPNYNGSAGWPLYSFVMAGLNLLDKKAAHNELNVVMPIHGPLREVTASVYYDLQDQWKRETNQCYSFKDMIKYFRDLRYQYGFSDKQY